MTPLEHLRAGNLEQAITALGEELRTTPLDPKRRTFLFELLCFAGLYDRAEKQLDLLANQTLGPGAAGLLAYRSALHAQRTRESMFLASQLPGTSDSRSGPGTCNDRPFRNLEDTDLRLGAHLEVFLAGEYTWVPLHLIQSVEVQAPTALRDLLWARGHLVFTPGAPFQDLGEVFLPALTPLAHKHPDQAVRLGRATVWDTLPDGTEVPVGQKLLQVDDDELPFLDLRSLRFKGDAAAQGTLNDAGA